MQLFLLIVRMLAKQKNEDEDDDEFFKPCDNMCCMCGIGQSGNTV